MSLVTRKVPTDFNRATGTIIGLCPFCDAATVAESAVCGVDETFWDVDDLQQCSHFSRFEEMRAVFEGPYEMLEGS